MKSDQHGREGSRMTQGLSHSVLKTWYGEEWGREEEKSM